MATPYYLPDNRSPAAAGPGAAAFFSRSHLIRELSERLSASVTDLKVDSVKSGHQRPNRVSGRYGPLASTPERVMTRSGSTLWSRSAFIMIDTTHKTRHRDMGWIAEPEGCPKRVVNRLVTGA